MIKNFLDADDDDSLITKHSADERPPAMQEFDEFAAPFARIEDEADLLEVPEPKVAAPDASDNQKSADEFDNQPSPSIEIADQTDDLPPSLIEKETVNDEPLFTENKEIKNPGYEIFSQSPYQSESPDETIRKSGLAYSAAIILFGSIVFTLILGWFADLLFGTSPWGKVGGIILGSIIGFIQFFRTTSQLFKDKD